MFSGIALWLLLPVGNLRRRILCSGRHAMLPEKMTLDERMFLSYMTWHDGVVLSKIAMSSSAGVAELSHAAFDAAALNAEFSSTRSCCPMLNALL